MTSHALKKPPNDKLHSDTSGDLANQPNMSLESFKRKSVNAYLQLSFFCSSWGSERGFGLTSQVNQIPLDMFIRSDHINNVE